MSLYAMGIGIYSGTSGNPVVAGGFPAFLQWMVLPTG